MEARGTTRVSYLTNLSFWGFHFGLLWSAIYLDVASPFHSFQNHKVVAGFHRIAEGIDA